MTFETKETNTDLWDFVQETDPDTTKRVNQRGGFTAIDAYSQIHRATQIWGPYGGVWKLDHCVYTVLHVGDSHLMMLEAVFVYPSGAFQIAADMALDVRTEATKKLRTDCITKSLSMLGFNADIFMGRFDDNKYVEAIKTKKVAGFQDTPVERFSWAEWVAKVTLEIDMCDTVDELKTLKPQWDEAEALLRVQDVSNHKIYVEAMTERYETLSQAAEGAVEPDLTDTSPTYKGEDV